MGELTMHFPPSVSAPDPDGEREFLGTEATNAS